MKLHWQSSAAVSCFHAAEAALNRRAFVDSAVASALAGPVSKLAAALDEERVPPQTFLGHVIPLSASVANLKELAERALIKTIGRHETPMRLPRFHQALTEIKQAFGAAVPQAQRTVAVSSLPLEQEWDYHGKSLLAGVANLTDPGILVEEATIVLVHPVLGGGGGAHLSYNLARIEAPVEAHSPSPEVVRLGWLLAMLNLDLPHFSEHITEHPLPAVAGLAMLPVVLKAAEELQLAMCDEATIELALGTWIAPGSKGWSKLLHEWWEVYTNMRPPWTTALASLDRLLAEKSAS